MMAAVEQVGRSFCSVDGLQDIFEKIMNEKIGFKKFVLGGNRGKICMGICRSFFFSGETRF